MKRRCLWCPAENKANPPRTPFGNYIRRHLGGVNHLVACVNRCGDNIAMLWIDLTAVVFQTKSNRQLRLGLDPLFSQYVGAAIVARPIFESDNHHATREKITRIALDDASCD